MPILTRTQTILVLKRPIKSHNPRMIHAIERVLFDFHVFNLLLLDDVSLLLNLDGIPGARMFVTCSDNLEGGASHEGDQERMVSGTIDARERRPVWLHDRLL